MPYLSAICFFFSYVYKFVNVNLDFKCSYFCFDYFQSVFKRDILNKKYIPNFKLAFFCMNSAINHQKFLKYFFVVFYTKYIYIFVCFLCLFLLNTNILFFLSSVLFSGGKSLLLISLKRLHLFLLFFSLTTTFSQFRNSVKILSVNFVLGVDPRKI